MDYNHFIGPPKVMYHTFGCKLNFAETSAVADMLRSRGFATAAKSEAPDLIVINTCSVTEEADKKCRQAIRSYARKWSHAAIIVTGCYAQLKPQQVADLPGVAIVAGSNQKMQIATYIDSWLANRQPRVEVIPRSEISQFVPSCSRGDRTRYFLKVQDGCDYFCSYCTIPFARGRSRSASIDSLVDQACQVAQAGGKEIVLTGVNVGDFGNGRSDTFFDLIKALDQVDGISRFRISSIEPNLLTEEIIRWVATSKRFMPHFHVPLQAGDDHILSLMRRRYDTALFASRIHLIRETIPHAFIGVDLIVGARGETAERFQNSRRFVESLPISRLHVFPYSERPGTRALSIDEEIVDLSERHRRARVMISISDNKLYQFQQHFIGQTRPVLLEERTHGGIMHGFTDNYIRVAIEARRGLANTIANVKLTAVNGDEMQGELIEP